MSGFTPGPWIVVERRVPYSLRDGHSNFHVERRIFTAAIHPQLKGHYPIVTGSTALGEKPGSPAVHLVSISEDDARLIAAAPDLLEALTLARSMCSLKGKVHAVIDAAIAKATGEQP